MTKVVSAFFTRMELWFPQGKMYRFRNYFNSDIISIILLLLTPTWEISLPSWPLCLVYNGKSGDGCKTRCLISHTDQHPSIHQKRPLSPSEARAFASTWWPQGFAFWPTDNSVRGERGHDTCTKYMEEIKIWDTHWKALYASLWKQCSDTGLC